MSETVPMDAKKCVAELLLDKGLIGATNAARLGGTHYKWNTRAELSKDELEAIGFTGLEGTSYIMLKVPHTYKMSVSAEEFLDAVKSAEQDLGIGLCAAARDTDGKSKPQMYLVIDKQRYRQDDFQTKIIEFCERSLDRKLDSPAKRRIYLSNDEHLLKRRQGQVARTKNTILYRLRHMSRPNKLVDPDLPITYIIDISNNIAVDDAMSAANEVLQDLGIKARIEIDTTPRVDASGAALMSGATERHHIRFMLIPKQNTELQAALSELSKTQRMRP